MDVNVSRMLPVAFRFGDKSGTSGIREPSRTIRQLSMPKLAARNVSQTWSGRPAPRLGKRPGAGKSRQCIPGKYPVPNRRCQFGISAVQQQIIEFALGNALNGYRRDCASAMKVLARPWRRRTCGVMVYRYRGRLACPGSTPPTSRCARPYCFRRRHNRRRS